MGRVATEEPATRVAGSSRVTPDPPVYSRRMAERVHRVTGRIAFMGGEEEIVPDLSALVAALAAASAENKTIQMIEILGKGVDGTDYRVLLEPVGVYKEQAPIGYQSLLLERALGEILISAGVCTPEQINKALAEQSKSDVKERLGEVVVRLGIATPQQVRDALLQQLGGKSG